MPVAVLRQNSISGLASSQAWDAGSCGKSYKPPAKTKKTNKVNKIKTNTNIRVNCHLEFGNPEQKNCQSDGDSVEAMSRHLWCTGTQVYMFHWSQPGPYSYRQELQIQVLRCTSQHTVGRELGRQSYWSREHLYHDHSSQADHRQGSFHLPLGVPTSNGRFEPEKEWLYDQLQYAQGCQPFQVEIQNTCCWDTDFGLKIQNKILLFRKIQILVVQYRNQLIKDILHNKYFFSNENNANHNW